MPIIHCLTNDFMLILTYFTARSNFVFYTFILGSLLENHLEWETLTAYDWSDMRFMFM